MKTNTTNQKREKKWWQHLLVIPVMAVIDVLALAAAGMADTASAGDGMGHPLPAFLLVAVMICGVLTVVLTIRALILCVKTIVRSHRGTNTAKYGTAPADKKAVWHCFIPLMIEIPLALIAVITCGYFEISSFYNDPMHVGFAFPIATFLLAGICLLVTIVLGLICIIAAVIRSRRNSGMNLK